MGSPPGSLKMFAQKLKNSLKVLRWLEDIGLPQYKETFTEYLIDGITLESLTAADVVEVIFICVFYLYLKCSQSDENNQWVSLYYTVSQHPVLENGQLPSEFIGT